MRKLFTFFLFYQLLSIHSSFGQIDEVRRITKTLCSPEFNGRGYVNGGDSIAAVFIANEFKKLGLKKVKRNFLQSFKFDVTTFPGEMEVLLGDKKLIPGVHFLVDPSSNGGKLTLNPKRISAKGALNKEFLLSEIKAIKSGTSPYNSIVLEFGKTSNDTLKLVVGLSEQIAEILPVIEIINKKFTWSVGRNQLANVLFQVQDSIYSSTKEWHIDIRSVLVKNHTANNVIAYLPSNTKKAKTIVFTAHYDHLGRMGQSTYFPGANDNASGTAMLISMAKYFKENPSHCNILFIAFAGEEAGLAGSEYFVKYPTFQLKKMDFLINLDIMGSGEEGITVVNATEHEAQFTQIQSINEEFKLLSIVKKRGPTKNSDHYWFTTKGVPAFFIYTQGPNKNYHDVFDTYENLSFVEYEDITKLLVKFVGKF